MQAGGASIHTILTEYPEIFREIAHYMVPACVHKFARALRVSRILATVAARSPQWAQGGAAWKYQFHVKFRAVLSQIRRILHTCIENYPTNTPFGEICAAASKRMMGERVTYYYIHSTRMLSTRYYVRNRFRCFYPMNERIRLTYTRYMRGGLGDCMDVINDAIRTYPWNSSVFIH
jgi:hypothetical protein